MEAEPISEDIIDAAKADTLALAIQQRREARVARSDRKSPQDHPRASSLGVCAREVYHQIADWQMRETFPVELLQRFRRGNEVESIVVRELLEDGFDVKAQQIAFELRETIHSETERGFEYDNLIICRGHMDGRIGWDGDNPVFEVKSLNPNVWGRIETARDFLTMGSFWVKYPRQMLLYLYQAAEPYGLFILDDCLGHWKILPVILDEWLDECEDALQVCRAAAIAARTAEPPPFYNDPETCLECWARDAGVCSPPLDFTPSKFTELHGEDFGLNLTLMAEWKEDHTLYAASDKAIKARMKLYGAGRYMAGNWLITCEIKGGKFYTTWRRIAETTDAPIPDKA